MGTILVVKGVSGSGKSTRVFLFLKFLEEILKLTVSDFYFTNFEGKSKLVGLLVEELGLVFIGKKYETNNFVRFQGYDVTTGYFGKSSYFSDFLRDNSAKYSFIVEGAGVTGTNRLRPYFLYNYCGFSDILIQYYNYNMDQHREYLDRIFYRSGKEPIKGTMWDKCSGFISDHRDSLKEIDLLKGEVGRIVFANTFYNLFDTPVYDFGCKALSFLDLEDFINSYISYCNTNNYITLNSFNNFNNG